MIDKSKATSFDISCGVPSVSHIFVQSLESQGLQFDPIAPLKLIIDIQRGFALHILETLKYSEFRLVVVTFGYCPAYWDDLSDLHPDVLIVAGDHENDIAGSLRRASMGERFSVLPKSEVHLRRTERRILRSLAAGLSNKEIAREVALDEKTVANTLSILFKEFGFSNRIQAALYYWGIWHKQDA